MLAQVKTKPLRGGPNGPVLTLPARAIRKVPRSGRRAGLQSNKELTNHLDTPNPHVSNPESLRGKILDRFAALGMTEIVALPSDYHPDHVRCRQIFFLDRRACGGAVV